MSRTPQQQHDPFEQVAARAGAAARATTERLPVTTAALHQHRRQRNTRRGLAVGAAALVGATVLTLVVLDRSTDTSEFSPAGPTPSASLTRAASGAEVSPEALSSVGLSISPPPSWTLTEDGPDVATFDKFFRNGHIVTAMAFVPRSVVEADGTLHPLPPGLGAQGPEDVQAWAATRTDITVGGSTGWTSTLGEMRGMDYEAPAGAPTLMCPEPPSATSCSVPPPDEATEAWLGLGRDEAGIVLAVVFYMDPKSPEEDVDFGELMDAFHR
jgi:hypothetical protein